MNNICAKRSVKVDVFQLESILYNNLKIEKKPTRAVEKSLEEYNYSRDEDDCICVMTVWRYYKKMKEKP